ncbi:hypothetical protein D3C86_2003740 [compost metagenome]
MVVVRLDRLFDIAKVHRAIGLMRNGLGLDRAQHGGATSLVAIEMRVVPGDELVAAPAMAHQRQQVRLRA